MAFIDKKKGMNKTKDGTSNIWFIVSVIVTFFLIALLTWNLLHSYRTIRNFETNKLALERASSQLLLHTKSMEMAAQMAAATGDLRWQESYNEHQAQLKGNLEKLPDLIQLENALLEVKNIENALYNLSYLEAQAFGLISRGEKNQASQLLSGWDYTKHKMEVNQAAENLAATIHDHVRNKVSLEGRLTYTFLILVFLCFLTLIVSWLITIKVWQANLKKRLEKEREITYLSYHDSLTGLYNRRYFEEEMKRLSVGRQLPLSIILGDVNNLKKTNDKYGHKKGDELLIEVANILKNAVREEDIVCRWGGDEFGIILPQTHKKTVQNIIARINEACKKSQFKPIRPSISLGFSVKTDTENNDDMVFTRAENMMYRKKKHHKRP